MELDDDTHEREDDAARVRAMDELDWRVYVERRLNRQDRVLGEIRNLLLVGKVGLRFFQWIGGAAIAAWGVYAAWRGIK